MHLEALGVLRRHVGIPPRGKEAAHGATRIHCTECFATWTENELMTF